MKKLMNKEPKPVSLEIMDNLYRVACPESERAALLEAAQYLNNAMQEIRDAGKILGMERVAVIAALNISYDLLKSRRENSDSSDLTSERVQELLHKVENVLSKSPQIEV